jgi:hypothetical protein
MLTFLSGFACGTVSTVAFLATLYFMLDRAVRPPSG